MSSKRTLDPQRQRISPAGKLSGRVSRNEARAEGGLENFPGLLKKLIRNKAWERRVHRGRTIELPSLHALITEKPIQGWGLDPKKVEAVIKDDPEALTLFREEMNGTLAEHRRPTKEEGNIKGDAVTFTKGNANDYWQARIARDCQ